MAYTYLFDIYGQIDHRLEDARLNRVKTDGDSAQEAFHQGRMDLLEELRGFVSESMDHKLPRRMKKRLKIGNPA